MTTGFTSLLIDKPETTFEEFALRCARGMGALIMMRDEPLDAPIPDEIPMEDFYHKSFLRSQARVLELERMTPAQADKAAKAAYKKERKAYDEWCTRIKKENALLTKMEKRVEAWSAPTPDHEDFKKFMLVQLRISKSTLPSTTWEPKNLSGTKWLELERRKASVNLARDKEYLDEENKRNEERNAWLKALRESLRSTSGTSPRKRKARKS